MPSCDGAGLEVLLGTGPGRGDGSGEERAKETDDGPADARAGRLCGDWMKTRTNQLHL